MQPLHLDEGHPDERRNLYQHQISDITMKLPKALLGAILVGITVQTTGCTQEELPGPRTEQGGEKGKEVVKVPDNCPACGMG
jgi:hypothetical protein